MRMSVDLPEPEGPITAVKVPAAVGGGAAEASAAGDDSPAEPGGALDQPTVEEPPAKS